MSVSDLRPTAFVVMPYGVKRDPHSRLKIDFDAIYQEAFVPAARRADVECVRADEERVGGLIHLAMFERLLLAEIVLADLTLASPNVMYELGIRHATRPRATVSVFASAGQLPFDLVPIRAIPYRLNRAGRLDPRSRAELIDTLAARLTAALSETAADSPLFQLIQSYPGVNLPHDVTESFQRRVETILVLSQAIRTAPKRLPSDEALDELRRHLASVHALPSIPTDLLIDLLLSFRDLKAWDDIVELFDQLPPEAQQHPSPLQVLAFALNRRKQRGDVDRAIAILSDLLAARGDDPETLGLLGRIYKDRYRELQESDPAAAQAALDAAIRAYERGFEADSRDYYPGINAVTLLMEKGGVESSSRARQLSPVVAFAVAGRGGVSSDDPWDVATVLELAVINLDEPTARRAAGRLRLLDGPGWNFETTCANLELLDGVWRREGRETPWIQELVEQLGARSGGRA